MMRNKKNLILMCIIACTWLSTLLALSMPIKTTSFEKIEAKKIKIDSVVAKTQLFVKKDSIKKELLSEVENYIYRSFPKTDKKIPTAIVENGLEHNIDIMFMMAQTQRETSFGTAGIGRPKSKRSLFGVISRSYETYYLAVSDYIAILKKSYLTKGRTEQDLMRRYTTTRGGRYAGDPNYESKLIETYSYINKRTKIRQLQSEYEKCKEN